jgi:hypothetical protein
LRSIKSDQPLCSLHANIWSHWIENLIVVRSVEVVNGEKIGSRSRVQLFRNNHFYSSIAH